MGSVDYNYFDGIKTVSLNSSAKSLIDKLKSTQGQLSSFKEGLTDDIWKANAKTPLLTACDKIDGEVYKEAIEKLNKISSVCSFINNFNSAKAQANNHKSLIKFATSDDPAENARIASNNREHQQVIADCEKSMQEAINAVKGLCG